MIEHLYTALGRPLGSRLATDDPKFLVTKLHEAKRKAKDARLDCLVIAISRDKPDSEVWIMHKSESSVAPQES